MLSSCWLNGRERGGQEKSKIHLLIKQRKSLELECLKHFFTVSLHILIQKIINKFFFLVKNKILSSFNSHVWGGKFSEWKLTFSRAPQFHLCLAHTHTVNQVELDAIIYNVIHCLITTNSANCKIQIEIVHCFPLKAFRYQRCEFFFLAFQINHMEISLMMNFIGWCRPRLWVNMKINVE